MSKSNATKTKFEAVLIYSRGSSGCVCTESHEIHAAHPEIAYRIALARAEDSQSGSFVGLQTLRATTDAIATTGQMLFGDDNETAESMVRQKDELDAFQDPRWKDAPCPERELEEALAVPPLLYDLRGLDTVAWGDLKHAYGEASDVPRDLSNLASSDMEIRERALWKLRGSVYHQGSIYSATPPAIPFLFELVTKPEPPLPNLTEILSFLCAIAESSSFDSDKAQLAFRDRNCQAPTTTGDEAPPPKSQTDPSGADCAVAMIAETTVIKALSEHDNQEVVKYGEFLLDQLEGHDPFVKALPPPPMLYEMKSLRSTEWQTSENADISNSISNLASSGKSQRRRALKNLQANLSRRHNAAVLKARLVPCLFELVTQPATPLPNLPVIANLLCFIADRSDFGGERAQLAYQQGLDDPDRRALPESKEMISNDPAVALITEIESIKALVRHSDASITEYGEFLLDRVEELDPRRRDQPKPPCLYALSRLNTVDWEAPCSSNSSTKNHAILIQDCLEGLASSSQSTRERAVRSLDRYLNQVPGLVPIVIPFLFELVTKPDPAIPTRLEIVKSLESIAKNVSRESLFYLGMRILPDTLKATMDSMTAHMDSITALAEDADSEVAAVSRSFLNSVQSISSVRTSSNE